MLISSTRWSITCPVCETINDPNADLCSKCGKPVDLETALKVEEQDKNEKQMQKDELARQGQAIEHLIRKIDKLEKEKERNYPITRSVTE